MPLPEIAAALPNDPAALHLWLGAGSLVATYNLATYGLSQVTLYAPLLIGVGSILAACNAIQANRIAKERLAFDRQRWEDERRARPAAAPATATVAVAAPSA